MRLVVAAVVVLTSGVALAQKEPLAQAVDELRTRVQQLEAEVYSPPTLRSKRAVSIGHLVAIQASLAFASWSQGEYSFGASGMTASFDGEHVVLTVFGNDSSIERVRGWLERLRKDVIAPTISYASQVHQLQLKERDFVVEYRFRRGKERSYTVLRFEDAKFVTP